LRWHGAALVPVNFMLNASEIAYILRHAGAKLLCVDAEFAQTGRAAAALDTMVESYVSLSDESGQSPAGDYLTFDSLCQAPAAPFDTPVASGDLAQIIYTSGTESLPKGAMLTRGAVIWQYVSCLVDGEIVESDAMLHAMPLFHCAQLDLFLGPSVYVGGQNFITGKPTPDNVLSKIAEFGINSFFAPPSVWISMLRSPLFDTVDLSSLRKGYYGASIMPVEVLLEMQRRLPQVRLWNFYGQTEIAPLATVLKPEDQLRKAGSAGRATLNVETRVVNDDMQDVAVGETGEIVHRSPQLLQGYFHRISAVSEVAVIGLPDQVWIEAVTAVVVIKAGHAVSEADVIEFCRANMAHFKVPKRVVFAETLPKNPSGKLLKRSLREQYSMVG
jgi:fatty-acyl-CoA synthase